MKNSEIANLCALEIKQAINKVSNEFCDQCFVDYPLKLEINGEVFDFKELIRLKEIDQDPQKELNRRRSKMIDIIMAKRNSSG